MHDIVVVGGGPAGTRTSALLAKDHDVLLIEEHASCGSPAQCTGLITERVLDLTGVRPDILNRLKGARFNFPDGRIIEVLSDRVIAVLVDRTDLDTRMAGKAMDAGAEVRCSVRYKAHRAKGGMVTIDTDHGELSSKVLVGADGHSSAVAASLGDNQPREYVRGIQYDIRARSDTMDTIDIYIGSGVAPGFFAWAIPFDDNVRLGLCTSWSFGPPMDYMRTLLRMTGLQDYPIIRKYSGKIPLGGRRTSYSDNVLLVGDAAGQVKAISGGGLYPGLTAAVHASDTIRGALRKGDLFAGSLVSYEKAWKKDIGKNLRDAYRFRKLYTKMDDDDFNRMYGVLNNDTMISLMKDIDIDDPTIIARKIIRHPIVAAKMLPMVLRSVL